MHPSPPVLLVVDDDPIVLGMMARILLEAGYAVHMASNGPDALAVAEQLPTPPDLVVTDLRIEPIGGAELAQLLFSRGLASRFLFVSGYGTEEEYNENFGPFLPKPFSPERLVEAVAGVLA
jgi:CheY-like chemotaxis protein